MKSELNPNPYHYIAFEKFFTVNSPEVISEYTKLQQ